jgi:acyl-CoA thioesterase
MEEKDLMKAKHIVDKMYRHDLFSQWLDIKLIDVKPGNVKLSLLVRPEFTNGFKVAHGGITYSLADSALAFASNGYGKHALSIETSISHTKPVFEGDQLTAITEELVSTRSLGIYHIKVFNQMHELVAIFKGTVYKKEKDWEI